MIFASLTFPGRFVVIQNHDKCAGSPQFGHAPSKRENLERDWGLTDINQTFASEAEAVEAQNIDGWSMGIVTPARASEVFAEDAASERAQEKADALFRREAEKALAEKCAADYEAFIAANPLPGDA